MASRKGKGGITVDMGGVTPATGGAPALHVDEGDYIAEILKKPELKTSQKNNPYLVWQVGIYDSDGDRTPGILYHNTVLTGESLRFFDAMMMAFGIKLPRKKLTLASILKKVTVGMRAGVTIVDDEEYEGKVKSKAQSWFPEEEFSDDEDEDGDYEDDEEENEEEEEEDDEDEEDDDEEEEGDDEEEEEDEDDDDDEY